MRRIFRFRRSRGKLSLRSFLCHNLVSTYCLVFVFWFYVFISVPSVSHLCFLPSVSLLFHFFFSPSSYHSPLYPSLSSFLSPLFSLPSSPYLFPPLHFSQPFATIILFLPPSPHIISPPLPSILAIFVSSASVLSTIRHHYSLPAILSFHPSLPYFHFLHLSPPSAPARGAKSYSF